MCFVYLPSATEEDSSSRNTGHMTGRYQSVVVSGL